MSKEPKEHVKKHLKKNKVDPDKLSNDVIEALNAFSEHELDKVDTLGEALMSDPGLSPDTRICAVH
jgi:thiamine pyrophosphokinase